MIRHALVLLSLLSGAAWAQEAPPTRELELLSEHPVEGMAAGNLSGLAWCGDALWAVSDREDDRLYRLDASDSVWQGEAEHFDVPPAPNTGLPWGVRVRSAITGLVRGGEMDFEGLSCDSLGNRYLASEAHAAVLRVSPAGMAEWLPLPEALVRQARASGMLLDFNAMFEGIAVDPEANRLWLAAERERRGLLVMHRNQSSWQCTGGCVLLAEGGRELPPPALGDQPLPRRFSGLAYFNDKLFTLPPRRREAADRLALRRAQGRLGCAAVTQTAGRRAGRVMLVLAWGAGILLATRFFADWEESRYNPNRQPVSVVQGDHIEVLLEGNVQGHFVADGRINGTPVTFLLDTGATDVAIPAELAEELGLSRGAPVNLLTANGQTTGFRTRLESLALGEIVLHDVRAIVAPGFGGDQILLGMSALKQLEFTQRAGTLVLRQHATDRP